MARRVGSGAVEWVCERCAAEDDDLVLVRRPDGAEDTVAAGGRAELWCFECRSTTAHVEVDEQG